MVLDGAYGFVYIAAGLIQGRVKIMWRSFFVGSLLPLWILGCGDKDGTCDSSGAYQCAGDVLQVCSDDGAWVDDTDCAEVGMTCHAEMGHCMADDSGSGT